MFRHLATATALTLLTTCGLSSLTHAGIFADAIAAFIPGDADLASGVVDTFSCIGSEEPLDPTYSLGSPNRRYVSIGELGSITLTFSGGREIFNGPGDDFIVYGSCNASNEPGRVFVSPGGTGFVAIGDFVSGIARYFDLASVGLSSVEFVRIDDLPGGTGLPVGQAFDVDALEGLHVDTPIPTARTTWGQLKATYR